MQGFTLPDLQRHWISINSDFAAAFPLWVPLLSETVDFTSAVLMALERRRTLAANCSYLLLAKSTNHALATHTLLERGLVIDAALCARNCVEAILLLTLCATDESGKYFQQWSSGKQFSASDVRKLLTSRVPIRFHDLEFKWDRDVDDLRKFVYKWLSEITHPNLTSLNHTVLNSSDGLTVFVGGSIRTSVAVVQAICALIAHELLMSGVTCAAISQRDILTCREPQLDRIKTLLTEFLAAPTVV